MQRDLSTGCVRLQILTKCSDQAKSKPNALAKSFALPISRDWLSKLRTFCEDNPYNNKQEGEATELETKEM